MTQLSNKNLNNSKWLAKVGMILIKVSDQDLINSLDCAWEENEDHDMYYEKTIDIYRDIERVLRTCPDVSNLRWLGDLRKQHFEQFVHHNAGDDEYFLMEASTFLCFELFLPKSERRYAYDVRYERNVIEKAHVIYNGMLFLAFAEIDDEVSPNWFGQEIREFLLSRLVSKRWEGVVVPPCPLHPEITVTVSSTSDRFEVVTNDEDDIEVLLPLLDREEPINFFEYFLMDNSFSITYFFTAYTMKLSIEELSKRIKKILASLTDNYMQLLKLRWYKIAPKLGLMRSSRQTALNLQVECNKFADCKLNLREMRGYFDFQASGTRDQNPFRNYFFKYLREPSMSLSEIRDTVKHMNNIVSEKYLQYSTIFAAIIGGIIGAIVTNIPFLISIISKSSEN